MILREKEAVDYLGRMKAVMGGDDKRCRFSNIELLKSMTTILKGFVESFPGEVGSYMVDVTGFPEIAAWVSDVKRALAMYKSIEENRKRSALPLLEQYAVGQVRGIADEGTKLSKKMEKDWALVQAIAGLERKQREFLTRLSLGRNLAQKGEQLLIYTVPQVRGALVVRDLGSVFQVVDAGGDRDRIPEFAGVKYVDPVVWEGEQKWVPWMAYFPIGKRGRQAMAVWSARVSRGIKIDHVGDGRVQNVGSVTGVWDSSYNDGIRYTGESGQLNAVGQTELKAELISLYIGSDLRRLSAVAAIKWFEKLAEFSGIMEQLEGFLGQVVEGRLTDAGEMKRRNETISSRLQVFYQGLGDEKLESEYRMVQAVVVNKIRERQEVPGMVDVRKGGVKKGLRQAGRKMADWWNQWW